MHSLSIMMNLDPYSMGGPRKNLIDIITLVTHYQLDQLHPHFILGAKLVCLYFTVFLMIYCALVAVAVAVAVSHGHHWRYAFIVAPIRSLKFKSPLSED
jgi:hypothetical protein